MSPIDDITERIHSKVEETNSSFHHNKPHTIKISKTGGREEKEKKPKPWKFAKNFTWTYLPATVAALGSLILTNTPDGISLIADHVSTALPVAVSAGSASFFALSPWIKKNASKINKFFISTLATTAGGEALLALTHSPIEQHFYLASPMILGLLAGALFVRTKDVAPKKENWLDRSDL